MYGVPDGIGYGLLRHLNIQTSTALARLGEPEIGFNYLGRFTASDGRPWGAVPETSGLGGGTDQGARVPHVLEINAWSEDTADGPEMTATWSWPEGVLSEGDVRCLMGAWSKALTAIVSYAENPEAGGRTPSDVPLIAIDQAGLDWLEATVPGKSDLLPLTPMQEGLLFHSLYDTDEDVYTVQLTVDVLGPLDANVLREAARTVIARHAALRSGFIQEVLPTPVAFMPPELDVPWREIEVVGSEEAEAIIAAEKAAPVSYTHLTLPTKRIV